MMDHSQVLLSKYGAHLARVLRLMRTTATRSGPVYLMRRRKAALVFSRTAGASSVYLQPPPAEALRKLTEAAAEQEE